MAVITAKFTRSRGMVKAGVRYIQHRAGREGEKTKRELFGMDGVMDRQQAYQMIDEAGKGTAFFHIVISPDPTKEDTEKDLHLAEITKQTMLTLEERLKKKCRMWRRNMTTMPPIGTCTFSPWFGGGLIHQTCKL